MWKLRSNLDLHLVQDYRDPLEDLGLDLYSPVQVYQEAHNYLGVLQEHKKILMT